MLEILTEIHFTNYVTPDGTILNRPWYYLPAKADTLSEAAGTAMRGEVALTARSDAPFDDIKGFISYAKSKKVKKVLANTFKTEPLTWDRRGPRICSPMVWVTWNVSFKQEIRTIK